MTYGMPMLISFLKVLLSMEIHIYTAAGKLIMEDNYVSVQAGLLKINTASLTPGTYYLQLYSKQYSTGRKIIIL